MKEPIRKKLSEAEKFILTVYKDVKCKTSDCYTIELLFTDENEGMYYHSYNTNGNFGPQGICMSTENIEDTGDRYKELEIIPYSIYKAVFIDKYFNH